MRIRTTYSEEDEAREAETIRETKIILLSNRLRRVFGDYRSHEWYRKTAREIIEEIELVDHVGPRIAKVLHDHEDDD